MARLNDNLFTTLVGHALPREMGCFFMTRLGWVRVRFTQAGLSELVFVEREAAGIVADSVFRGAFLEWVDAFGRLDAARKWRYLDPAGTNFQQSVWRALLDIPFGGRTSYGEIAAGLGRPGASRAVGSAVGANPVSLLIPCHRVLPSAGGLGSYRWGADRKLALLDAEQAPGAELRGLFA